MKRATAIIGAAWGDEGKGLMVDYHASRPGPRAVVVRFNGGAQAGHTVVTPDGKSHVFSHFGSGTLAGAETYLSQHFVVNPLLWRVERDVLKPKLGGALPKLTMSRSAKLSTPYDMIVNKELEIARGDARHGSCGVGINETVERCEVSMPTTVSDMTDPDGLRERLQFIRERARERLTANGVVRLSPSGEEAMNSIELLNEYLDACFEMMCETKVATSGSLREFPRIIFEGAQGLLLDEGHRFFPHVTRSRTGLLNALGLAAAAGVTDLDVVHVLRSYMTRHGAGPFPSEDENMQFEDTTNEPDEFQGVLRFGRIDDHLIGEALWHDLDRTLSTRHDGLTIRRHLAITHLDQTADQVLAVDGPIAPEALADRFGLRRGFFVRGPTRDDVTPFEFAELRRSGVTENIGGG